MQQSLNRQTNRVPDVKCKYDILYVVGPAPCDKKCHSEHQTLFPLFGGGVWAQNRGVLALKYWNGTRTCVIVASFSGSSTLSPSSIHTMVTLVAIKLKRQWLWEVYSWGSLRLILLNHTISFLAWSSIVRIGVLECSASQPNQQICSTFNVQGYPTIKVWCSLTPATNPR